MVDVPERNPASCEHRLLTGVVCRAGEAVDCGDDLPETVLRMAVVFLELQRPVARQRAKNQHLRPVAQQRPETGLSVQFAIHIIYACNNILHESRASAGVRPRQACPGFPPAGAAYGPDSQKTDKHPAACNRLPSAGDTAKLSKKETGSCEPVPFIFRCCKNLFGCDNDNLDVSEDALVALHLALELTELLDVGNGDVLALDLDACGCENLGNLG